MQLELDQGADAAYVTIHARPVARTQELDAQRIVDYDAAGEIVGIEFLAIRHGVELSGLPFQDQLARLFADREIRVGA
jgi:uncharacterized protein YuzE